MGPNTDLSKRLNPDYSIKPESIPLNSADFQSYLHDVAYDKAIFFLIKIQHQKIEKYNYKTFGRLIRNL